MQKYNILNDLGNNRNEMLVRLASCAGVVWAFYLSYFDVALAAWKTFLFFFWQRNRWRFQIVTFAFEMNDLLISYYHKRG